MARRLQSHPQECALSETEVIRAVADWVHFIWVQPCNLPLNLVGLFLSLRPFSLRDDVELLEASLYVDVVLALGIGELLWNAVVEEGACFCRCSLTVELNKAKAFANEIAAKFRHSHVADISSSAEDFCNLRVSELWREILHIDSGLIHPFRVDSCKVEWKSALDQLAAFTQLKDVRFCGGLLK